MKIPPATADPGDIEKGLLRPVAHPPGTLSPDEFYVGDAVQILKQCEENSIDLTVTSPPYEDLRNYKGFNFDPESMLKAIYRVTRPGGVCVWVVGERIDGSRSLTSFQQAFIGRECGFGVHDVMIYQKKIPPS